MAHTLVNPLDETVRPQRNPAPRLSTLSGKTIGLLDISKPGGNLFFDRVEHLLKERCGVKAVVRITKPTFTKPAPPDIIKGLISQQCHAVIEALAD
jgi:hypothetical protein